MQHKLCDEFMEFWQSRCQEAQLPGLVDKHAPDFKKFAGSYIRFGLQNSDIIICDAGADVYSVLPRDEALSLFTDLYSLALKPMQMALVMPCFLNKAGFSRRSRIWYGHRHKVVDWLFLPVVDDKTAEIFLEGIAVSSSDHHEDDRLMVGSSLVERILVHNFISCAGDVDISAIDQHAWAVLEAMDAKILVDGEEKITVPHGLGGNAALLAAQAARSNVLAVASEEDVAMLSQRLKGQYNLRFCHSYEKAIEILKNDMVDVLVVTENFNGGTGLDLVQEAQRVSAFTASVFMLEQKANREDVRIVENGSFVQCLVKPVGEFALRKALDDASAHALKKT